MERIVASRSHGPPGEAQCLRPEGSGMMSQFDHLADCRHKFGNLGRRDYQWRSDFQHHEIVSAYLGKDAAISKKTHDKNLPKHRRMNLGERFEWNTQGKASWSVELNPA